MENSELAKENKVRIEKLEEFKHDIEKKLYAAVAVATVLGITSLIGGLWINSLTKKLQDLSEKTEMIEKKLSDWNAKINESFDRLEEKKINICNEIDNHVELSFEDKKEEVVDIGAKDIIEKLQDGSATLILNSLQIKNMKGNTIFSLSADSDGDGIFRMNSDQGKVRYLLKLGNDRPYSTYFNSNQKSVFLQGVLTDMDVGFARFYDSNGEKKLLELNSNARGGFLNAYSSGGKQIVFLGGDNNTGNGLVNVMSLDGEKKSSHYPN